MSDDEPPPASEPQHTAAAESAPTKISLDDVPFDVAFDDDVANDQHPFDDAWVLRDLAAIAGRHRSAQAPSGSEGGAGST